MTKLAAGLCAFTFFVHVFAGQRRVVGPLRAQVTDPFAAAVLVVVWHMVTWTLAVLAVALLLQPTWLVPALCGGFAVIFVAVSQRFFSAAIRLPQWILFGAIAVYSAAPAPAAVLLAAIALVHLAWALGFSWPEKDLESLALAIIGRRVLPSRLACLAVAGVLSLMIWALLAPGPAWTRYAIAAVFLLRGTLGFVEPLFRAGIRRTPYLQYSRYMYTPLAFSLGVAALLSR